MPPCAIPGFRGAPSCPATWPAAFMTLYHRRSDPCLAQSWQRLRSHSRHFKRPLLTPVSVPSTLADPRRESKRDLVLTLMELPSGGKDLPTKIHDVWSSGLVLPGLRKGSLEWPQALGGCRGEDSQALGQQRLHGDHWSREVACKTPLENWGRAFWAQKTANTTDRGSLGAESSKAGTQGRRKAKDCIFLVHFSRRDFQATSLDPGSL